MDKVTHIVVYGEECLVQNPYYSSNNRHIEPEMTSQFKQKVIHLYSEKQFKNYLIRNPETIDSKKYAFYKVEELFPKITTHVTIDV